MKEPIRTELEHKLFRAGFKGPVQLIIMNPFTYNALVEELIATNNLHLLNLVDQMHTFKGTDIYRSLDIEEGKFKITHV